MKRPPRGASGSTGAAFPPADARAWRARGWPAPDIVFVSGDAYVDHPSFAAAILCRVLERAGFRVALLVQPDWLSAEPWRRLGRPRLFYAVSAGNMDSMINHYTANKKRRNEDAYSPGGRIGLRPDRATNVYAQRCREAFPGVPVVIGGVEASLRRIAHYDWWSDRVLPSILATSKADLLGYGMGEGTIVEIARRLAAGAGIQACRDLRGVAYLLGRTEALPEHRFGRDGRTIELPAYERVAADRRAFAEMTRLFLKETNPFCARRLVQRHGDRLLVVNPPPAPPSTAELDSYYDLPYRRRPHPIHREPIPAFQTIRDSVQAMRGCFGGCAFCSITMHQGRAVQSRSRASILRELERLASDPQFKGTVSDVGGPTANMWRMRCSRPEVEAVCRRQSCIHPSICRLLDTDHGPTIELLRKARSIPGIRRVLVASGVRMDLALRDPVYLDELAAHHTGGHLKVAPEHVSPRVLAAMRKPEVTSFEAFRERFAQASRRAGKEQYLVPYFIAGHPGCTLSDMVELALYLHETGFRPRQVQDFIPAPMDLATCMFHTGLDPFTGEAVPVAKGLRERRLQRALLQYFLPANRGLVREALRAAGRPELIPVLLGRKGAGRRADPRRGGEASGARARGTRRGRRGQSPQRPPARPFSGADGRSWSG